MMDDTGMLLENHYLVMTIGDKKIRLNVVDSDFTFVQIAQHDEPIHILASGPSIQAINLSSLQNQAVIFVNGSITLTKSYVFSKPVAYIITDPRFIKHNLEIVLTFYTGFCPIYISDLVAEQLLQDAPDFLFQYESQIRIIYPVKRPVMYRSVNTKELGFFKKIAVKLQKRPKLKHFKHSPYHAIDKKIGVSFDIRHGFVEGGTVAYVALQLAFTLGFRHIHLYGMDLLNSHTPRFYETTQHTAPSKLDNAITNRIVPSFDFASQHYQKIGVSIYNHSPISKQLFSHIPYQPN